MPVVCTSDATEWLDAETVIPMHYNTFGAINVNINEFKTKIQGIGKTPLVLNIGESVEM